jgi:hypothetical protein
MCYYDTVYISNGYEDWHPFICKQTAHDMAVVQRDRAGKKE